MDSTTDGPHVTYVTPVDEDPKLTRHQAFYQRNSHRLRKESKKRWERSRTKFETLSKSEQEAVKERRRQVGAAYREKHREELRAKEKMRRQRRKATKEHSEK